MAGSTRQPSQGRTQNVDDLSVPVPQFVERLKMAYVNEKYRFQSLSRSLTKALKHSPAPGPCTFVARCVEELVGMGPSCSQDIGHLITRSLGDLDESFKLAEDISYSKQIAAKMFRDAIDEVGRTIDRRLLVRLIVVLQIQISDVAQAYYYPLEDEAKARMKVESFILNLVKQRSYTSAVALLKHFDLQDCTSREFLLTMVREGQPDLAGKWAEHLGKDSCSFLVQQCTKMELYKIAYRLVKRYSLENDFPDAFYLYRRSSLRKLVGKGLWDIAESIAGEDRILQEYMIMLALGRNKWKKAVALSETFQLKDLDLSAIDITEIEEVPCNYIQLQQILERDKVVWVDNAEHLNLASKSLSDAKIIGIDGEWKANRIKGEELNKVSILQIGTKQNVFILDLLKLANDSQLQEILNQFIKQIFDSSAILKLGYGIQNDLNRLAQSYPQLDAFHSCKMFIDLECFPGDRRLPGGISGLAKSAMGSELDKSIRMSDWSHRPLTREQLDYAALDAVILLPVHEHVCYINGIKDGGCCLAKTWLSKKMTDKMGL